MSLSRSALRWAQAFVLWAALAAFVGGAVGVGVVVSRLVITVLGGP